MVSRIVKRVRRPTKEDVVEEVAVVDQSKGDAPSTAAHDSTLLLLTSTLNDIERTRIASENRLRSLIQVKGMEKTPEAIVEEQVVDGLMELEKHVDKTLKAAMKVHPLGGWCDQQRGVGYRQLARLLGEIGDPGERPNVAKLWAYCGMHVIQVEVEGDEVGVAPVPKRGQQMNWNPDAKMRIHLIAESCVKQPLDSKWRQVYDAARGKYAESVHMAPCNRCGPSGKPAQVGTELNPGHKHARALRIVGKEILKELWRESKRLRGEDV